MKTITKRFAVDTKIEDIQPITVGTKRFVPRTGNRVTADTCARRIAARDAGLVNWTPENYEPAYWVTFYPVDSWIGRYGFC